MIHKNNECIDFDGKQCRNAESYNYNSYGEHCIDCKDIKEEDNIDTRIEDFINERNNLKNIELWDILEDQYSLIFIYNDFLNLREEFVKEIKRLFDYIEGVKYLTCNKGSTVKIVVPKKNI